LRCFVLIESLYVKIALGEKFFVFFLVLKGLEGWLFCADGTAGEGRKKKIKN